jgi:hypothetical protein
MDPIVLPQIDIYPDQPNGLPGSLAAADGGTSGLTNSMGGASAVISESFGGGAAGLGGHPGAYPMPTAAQRDPTDATAQHIIAAGLAAPHGGRARPDNINVQMAALQVGVKPNLVRDMMAGRPVGTPPGHAASWDADLPELQFAPAPPTPSPLFMSLVPEPWQGDFTAPTMTPRMFDPTPMKHLDVSPNLLDPQFYPDYLAP